MKTQVALRDVAPATTDFIHLPMAALPGAKHSRTDAGAIALHADGFDLDPMILERAVTPQKLWIIVDAVHNRIQIAVVIEITDRASASGDQLQNAGPRIQ